MPSTAPTNVISEPLLHQKRTVMSDLAAPTAKCAARDTMAETITPVYPLRKKKGNTGMKAPIAVERAPETAAVHGLRRASSV